MAMPEVNIGLFPDVGGSYFLSRTPGRLGFYLGVSGAVIDAADALHAGLADVFVPGAELAALCALAKTCEGNNLPQAIRHFAAPFASHCNPDDSTLAKNRPAIDHHFAFDTVAEMVASLIGLTQKHYKCNNM